MVCVIWGGAFPAIKYLLSFFTPLELVKLRYILAMPFFLVILLKRRKTVRAAFRSHLRPILIASFFGVIGYNLSLAFGEMRIPPGIASLIINLSPVFTLTMSVMFLGERIDAPKLAGMLLSFLGLVVLVHLSSPGGTDYYLFALITLMAPISWAIYTVSSKALTERYDTLTVTSLAIVLGTIPLLFFLRPRDLSLIVNLPPVAWIVLIYLSYLCTAAGYLVWVLALRRMPSSSVASFVYLIPVFAVLISHFSLGEPITVRVVTGALLLLSGVYIVNRNKRKGRQNITE